MPIQLTYFRASCLRRFVRQGLTTCAAAGWLLGWGMSCVQAEPQYFNSRRFRIPFVLDASELHRLQARELKLFVSTDQGGSWDAAQTVPPEATRFTFEAPRDGEYWFAVKTIVPAGEYPPGPQSPSLQVIIDSTPPVLELQLEEVEPGRVRLIWNARDEHLDINSLKLEFSNRGQEDWKPVAIRSEPQGQTTWTADSGGVMQVRGSISDLAGHETTATTETAVGEDPRRPARLDFTRPVADGVSSRPGIAANSPLPSVAGARPQPQLISGAPSVQGLISTPTQQHTVDLPIPVLKETSPPGIPTPSVDTSAPATETSRPRRRGHLVNSRLFRVAYEIDGVGPSGVASVELYITEDGGKKWFHYGADPDRTSPFEVNVPGDGDYGFAFRVANGLGLSAAPPQPGDEPEVYVTVDRSPPTVQLLPIRQGQGAAQNMVLISWKVEDRDLDERPIALSYSTQPTGPWEPIVGWIADSGSYEWTLPEMMNQKFYLRIEARDAAGNIARVDSDQPFLIDRSAPRARVTDVESLKGGIQR